MEEPKPLIDDPEDPALARLLGAARADVLPPESLARVKAAVLVVGTTAAVIATTDSVALAASATKPAAAVAGKVFGIGLGKLVVGLAVTGMAVGGVVAVRRASPGATPIPPPSSVETVVAPPASAPVPAAVASPTVTAPAAVASAVPTVVTPTKPKALPSAPPSVAQPKREGVLLLEARKIVEKDPARALALVRAHELEFPKSQLAPERKSIELEALRRLGSQK